MRNFQNKYRSAAWILGILAIVLIVGVAAINLQIGWSVRSFSKQAVAQFGGEPVEALIGQVDCETCSLKDRNHAVWALGQLRDKRALPVLHKYYTGEPCDHSRKICQYELSKAIRWTEGNSFMLPRLWRPFL